jgi:hypothetical protein
VTVPPLPDVIEDAEDLGRAIFDGKKAAAAKKGKFHPRVFTERDGVKDLSVDRLSFGDLQVIAAIQDTERGTHCHGWAVVSAASARQNGRTVISDRLDSNPYHALIVLPEAPTPEEFIAKQIEHGVELALAAQWRVRPQP